MADLHLDTKFDSLSQINGLPQKRRLEQRKALKQMIEYIKENEIEIFLISGDLYEQKYIRKSSIEYINNLFKEIPNVQIFIAPGNHDPYIANSFYSSYPWSENVHIFKENIEKIDYKDIHIYGFGFTDYYCKQSEIEEIEIENKKDINILITHGALDGSSDELREYNPIRETKLKKLGFDYIALGHIHKPYYNEEKNQKIVYPGSPISLGFDELGTHGVISGEISKKELKLEFIQIDTREYVEKEIDITNLLSIEEIIEKIENLTLDEKNLYKIILTGRRYFPIKLEEITKLINIENIVKIRNHTKPGIDIEKLAQENTIKGIFVRRMLERKEKENLDEDFVEKTIEIGLEVL
jgi:DNA repair exonuclease SbcCD nuclease subunit